MAIELAAAYVTIIPSLKGANKQIQSQLTGVDVKPAGEAIGKSLTTGISSGLNVQTVGAQVSKIGDSLQSVGKGMQNIGSSLTNSITKPAVVAGAAVGGLVSALGFKRLVGIDTARGQFKGLGHDADAVMAQVDKGVTNTALSMAEGASLAVGILSTGNLPLEQLESQLKRVANVSAAYGVESEQAGYLLNNVLTKNKVTYGDLSQMVQNQIPIISMLADHYGVTGDEIQKMANDGKISIEDFNEVLDNNAGAAAEEYAKTWKGVTSNIIANLGKLGAKLMGPAFETFKTQASDALAFLQSDEIAAWADRAGAAIGGLINLVAGGQFTSGLREAFGWEEDAPVVGAIIRIRDAVIGLFDIVVKGNFTEHLRNAFGWEEDSPIVGFLMKVHDNLGKIIVVALAAGPAISLMGRLVSGIGAVVSKGGAFLSFLGGGSAGAKALGAALRFLTGPWGLLIAGIAAAVASSPELQAVLGELVSTIGGALGGALKAIMPVFQQLADAVLPIVTAAVGMLAGVLTEIIPVFSSIVSSIAPLIAQIVGSLVPVIGTIISAVQPIIQAIMPAFAEVFRIAGDVVRTVFEAIGPIIEGALTYIAGIIQVVTSVIQGDWEGVWSGIKQMFLGTWEMIKGIVVGAVKVVSSVISGSLNVVKAVWNGVWSAISGFFSNIWDSIVSAATGFLNSVKEKFTSVTDFISGIPAKVLGFFANIGTTLLDSGRALIQGFLDGIMAGFNKAKEWVSDGLAGIRNLFPFSPAKEGPFSGRGWVLYSGLSLGETFTEAIADSLHDGKSDVVDELDDLESEFDRIEDFANGSQFSVRAAVPDLPERRDGGRYDGPPIEVHTNNPRAAALLVADELRGRKEPDEGNGNA